jgi:N-glycosylase/DNA lyase
MQKHRGLVIYLTFEGDRFNNPWSRLDGVSVLQHLNAELSINSGQEFLWERVGNNWYGIRGGSVVRFSATDPLGLKSFPGRVPAEDVFRLGDDMGAILGEISRDPLVKSLVAAYPGLRLMRQDAEQCLFSFLCASNTNIPMIRRMLRSLCARFGKQVRVDGQKFHAFPSAKALDRASEAELRAAGLGYRAKAIKAAAREIAQGSLDLESLKKASYEDARSRLLEIYGVGPKIADCVLLFSLEKLDAFPIDVWIARALASHYDWLSDKKMSDKLTARQYEDLSSQMRRYFGAHAGYAQQYLYYHMRQAAGKRW